MTMSPMNRTRYPTIVLALLLAGCGVSPTVLVEPSAGNVPRTPAPRATPARPGTTRPPHTVVRGDTLYSIAFRNGVDVRELIAWNRIPDPFTIYPGQRLRLDDPVRTAGPVASPHAAAATPAAGVASPAPSASVAVRPGDTVLGPQPLRDDAPLPTAQVLADEPIVAVDARSGTRAPVPVPPPRPAPGQPGSLIAAIGAAPVAAPSAAAPPSPGFKPATPAALPPPRASAAMPTVPPPGPAAAAAIAVTPDPVLAPIIDASGAVVLRQGIQWRWPTAGNVIGRFIAGDPTQQGIDIAGRLGQPVLAVADGDVVYSGNGLLGYGEMIIVQHSPDFLSAYGHNQRRLVSEGNKVKGGQRIAEMGQRGSTVMLHFEIRQRGKPIDPMTYLPH